MVGCGGTRDRGFSLNFQRGAWLARKQARQAGHHLAVQILIGGQHLSLGLEGMIFLLLIQIRTQPQRRALIPQFDAQALEFAMNPCHFRQSQCMNLLEIHVAGGVVADLRRIPLRTLRQTVDARRITRCRQIFFFQELRQGFHCWQHLLCHGLLIRQPQTDFVGGAETGWKMVDRSAEIAVVRVRRGQCLNLRQ